MTTSTVTPGDSSHLGSLAVAAAVASVRCHQERRQQERELRHAESLARQSHLAASARKLEHAATKTVAGTALAGSLQLVAAGAQVGSAVLSGVAAAPPVRSDPLAAQLVSARIAACQGLAATATASSKVGDLLTATASYDRAAKARHDVAAAAAEQSVRCAEDADNSARDQSSRELGHLDDLVTRLHAAALAAARA